MLWDLFSIKLIFIMFLFFLTAFAKEEEMISYCTETEEITEIFLWYHHHIIYIICIFCFVYP